MRALQDRIPEHAKDLRLNLGALERVESLTPAQLWGTVLAVAHATRSFETIRAAEQAAGEHLDAASAGAARTAAALMGMNNVYYRFRHLCSNDAYSKLPARLRMQGLASHGADAVDFELWCLAVSAVNGCGACVDAHERKLRQEGATEEAVHDAVRVAAVVHGAAVAIEGSAATTAAEPF